MTGSAPHLDAAARARGVQPEWVDGRGRVHRVPTATLERLVDLLTPEPARRSRLPPVVVAWDGIAPPVALGSPTRRGAPDARLELEGTGDLDVPVTGVGRTTALHLPAMPPGRHRLRVVVGDDDLTADVLSAPRRCHPGPAGVAAREWGIVHPTATLWSGHTRVVGDLGDLRRLAGWSGRHGATVVATLPLLAAFADDPSPYAPVSRRFWNEAYVDLDAVPARWWSAAGVAPAELSPRRPDPLVDPAEALRHRRGPLDALAAWIAGEGRDGDAAHELREFVAERPDVVDYARFRARGERDGPDWRSWGPGAEEVAPGGAHLVGQWLMQRQLDSLASDLAEGDQALYLDLPIGCHGAGYDVWRRPWLFAEGVDAGAPPDAFFAEGQSWGFPPLRPDTGRADRWRDLEACLDHHMAVAGRLRIDHVMGLRRLFWVPHGAAATDGAYVHYPADELLAVVSLVSHRHRCGVVGEDLGTVPEEVERLMADHDVAGMYVVQFEVQPDRPDVLAAVPEGSVASVGTHDLPTLRGWWAGRDLDARVGLGQVGPEQAEELMAPRRRARAALADLLRADVDVDAPVPPDGLLAALLEHLGGTDAGLLLVDLADLLGDDEQVNLPGTTGEQRANWRRRMRVPLEGLDGLDEVAATLARVRAARATAGRRARDTVAATMPGPHPTPDPAPRSGPRRPGPTS